MKRAKSYSNASKRCNLCIWEFSLFVNLIWHHLININVEKLPTSETHQSNHSTNPENEVHPSMRLIRVCMNNGEITGLISVDIRKAFDSFDHKILFKKMQEQFGVRNMELKCFQSYLTNPIQVCDKHTSSAMEIVRGVP